MEPDGFDRDHLSPAAAVSLALALLDQGELHEVRGVLESLLESLGEAGSPVHRVAPSLPHPAGFPVLPDATLAAATAATLALVGSLDDEGFERAFDGAEVEEELLLHADGVAAQVLDAIPAEASDEIVPGASSPFATRTFADLLARQGHEAEAENLRSALGGREDGSPAPHDTDPAPDAAEPPDRVVNTLERWLLNLGRTPA